MGAQGRPGVFHFEQRITQLKRKHVDCHHAIVDLLLCLCVHGTPNHEKLLKAPKEGKLLMSGNEHTSEEMSKLKASKSLVVTTDNPQSKNPLLDQKLMPALWQKVL